MSARDELLARLTAERFTRHERTTVWSSNDEGMTALGTEWQRLKSLREAMLEKPYKQGVLDELCGTIEVQPNSDTGAAMNGHPVSDRLVGGDVPMSMPLVQPGGA
jgi:hypothetical protein